FGPSERAAGVLAEGRHGNHQEGTIRMGSSVEDGIVDGWGTSFDLQNLHVVSTAILPTSSQANPTLTALQLGLRLVDRLVKRSQHA
ncbi:MAG: GMC oxidoreductase, partial [Jannaschia sp.]